MLADLARKINDYVENYESNLVQVLATVDHVILDINRDQLKNEQITALGKPVLPEYSSRWKALKGLVYPNLLDTGDFHNKFVFNSDGKKAEIHSTDKKDQKLRSKYGEEIHGIAPKNRGRVYSITKKAIGKDFKTKIR
jgi:hypothetical protein